MDIDEYRSHINRLVAEMSGETVLNGSHAHAAIIVERMFANAKNEMAIITRNFDPRIYGAGDTVDEAELFLGNPSRTARVVIENCDDEALERHPFWRRLHAYPNLKFYKLDPTVSQALKVNFSVMDDNGYRFEKDKTEPVAIASFGDAAFAAKLKDLFERICTMARPLVPQEQAA
jgi:hypothetical protein